MVVPFDLLHPPLHTSYRCKITKQQPLRVDTSLEAKTKKKKIEKIFIYWEYGPLNMRECNYLGVMLTETLSIDKDVDRMTSSFLKYFNSLFYEFIHVDRKVLTYLFRTNISSFFSLKNLTLLDCKRNF